MDLKLLSKQIVGFIWLMLASVTEPRTPTIVQVDSEEWKCDPPCDNASGKFCLLRQCIKCGPCPKDPFDLAQNGYLIVYTPCLQNGFCPKVCSTYLNLGSHPLANETFCEQINAPKVTTTQSTTNIVDETTTTSSTGTTSVKPEAEPTTTKHPVKITDIGKEDFPGYMYVVAVAILFFGAVLFFVGFLGIKKIIEFTKPPGSSTCSLTEDTDPLILYKPLEIELDEENKTATVLGLQRLNCTALQLCACLYNPDRPDQNWKPTDRSDEMQLEGVMIPHQSYTVKAGRVINRREFECIAEGKVDTEDFSNVSVTLDEECSTTIENIFTNIELRKSLQTELYQPSMIDVIVQVFELTGDSFLDFKHKKDLGILFDETLTSQNVILHSSVHILMKNLAQHVEAKDFVRKIAKRDTERYCKKCLELLHSMCCGNLDASAVVIDLPSV